MSFFYFIKDFISKYLLNDPKNKTLFKYYFFDSKYFCHSTASIEDSSILLNSSSDQLDHISKVYKNFLFETLLNDYRYKYFLDELNNPS